MEKNKLSDDKIIKALEFCLNRELYCDECPLHDKHYPCLCANKLKEESIDLIHRLQAENDRLNDMKFTQEHCDLYKENEWLKAEIKRELAEHEEFTKQAKAEIERLKDEYAGLCGSNNRLKERISKYKMQVDELKKSQANKYALEAVYNNGYEQAVKDTAKEILEDFDNHGVYSKDYTNFMRKEYGVEVE